MQTQTPILKTSKYMLRAYVFAYIQLVCVPCERICHVSWSSLHHSQERVGGYGFPYLSFFGRLRELQSNSTRWSSYPSLKLFFLSTSLFFFIQFPPLNPCFVFCLYQNEVQEAGLLRTAFGLSWNDKLATDAHRMSVLEGEAREQLSAVSIASQKEWA